MNKQLRALFFGHVQGVGFRYTARSLARGFSVTGYVKNLSNGSVELIAEGDELEVRSFLSAVKSSSLCDHIREVKEVWSEAQGLFNAFEITM